MRAFAISLTIAFALAGAGRALAAEPVQALRDAAATEQSDELPLTSFYSTPPNLASSRPGDLLRSEPFQGYALPAGATAVRILYHSLNGAGAAVATSGVVLIPAGEPPSGGWPVIAWAHGTSGVARRCAPSAMKDVYYGADGLAAMLSAGFAVVATDYHGLGTGGAHQYLDPLAQPRDVIYSLPAARSAVASLGKRWVVDGHSQGAFAAWRVAELESRLDDPTYLGAVAVASGVRKGEFLAHLNDTPGLGFVLAYVAYGIEARYPAFKPQDMLTPAALAPYREATTQGCWYTGAVAYQTMKPGSLLRARAGRNPWVRRYLAGLLLGRMPAKGPIFALAGEADTTVPIDGIRATVRHACRIGQHVEFRAYPGLDHHHVMANTISDQLAWIRARFAGEPAQGNCATVGN